MPTARVDIKGNGSKLKDKLRKIAALDDLELKVGFFENARYPDGTPVAVVAYKNEYGADVPPRPFMKRTAQRRIKAWSKGIAANFNRADKSSLKIAYSKAGQVAVGDVKRTIKDWSPTDPRPNSPATIAAKARRARSGKNLMPINPTTVLIDTGKMISSVAYEVANGRD